MEGLTNKKHTPATPKNNTGKLHKDEQSRYSRILLTGS